MKQIATHFACKSKCFYTVAFALSGICPNGLAQLGVDPRKGPQRLCGNRRGYFQESGNEREIAAILFSICLSSLSIPTGPFEGPNQLPPMGVRTAGFMGVTLLHFLANQLREHHPQSWFP